MSCVQRHRKKKGLFGGYAGISYSTSAYKNRQLVGVVELLGMYSSR